MSRRVVVFLVLSVLVLSACICTDIGDSILNLLSDMEEMMDQIQTMLDEEMVRDYNWEDEEDYSDEYDAEPATCYVNGYETYCQLFIQILNNRNTPICAVQIGYLYDDTKEVGYQEIEDFYGPPEKGYHQLSVWDCNGSLVMEKTIEIDYNEGAGGLDINGGVYVVTD